MAVRIYFFRERARGQRDAFSLIEDQDAREEAREGKLPPGGLDCCEIK